MTKTLPSGRRSMLAFRLALAFGGVLSGLVVAEVAARLFLGGDYSWRMSIGVCSESTFFFRPGSAFSDSNGQHYSYDAEGFRNTGLAEPFDKTVLFIGDSFTEGRGVADDQTFAATTGRNLAKRGVRVRSLNAGIAGMGAAQELRLMRRLLDTTSVDAVVLQSFPHNDIADNWEDGGFALSGDRLVSHDPPAPPLVIRLRNAIFNTIMIRNLIVVRLVANTLSQKGVFDVPENDEAPYEVERLLLRDTVTAARAHGIPILIVVVGADPLECHGRVEGHAMPYDVQYHRVRDMVKNMDVPSLDLCTIASRPESFGAIDKHYSPLGNAVIGEAIAEKLAPVLAQGG